MWEQVHDEHISIKRNQALYKVFFHGFILLLGFLMVYPVLWMISGSFKTNYEILNESLKLMPQSFSLDNFIRGWRGFGTLTFALFFRNSFIITILATAGVTISSSLVAYAFARVRFPGRKLLFAFMMSTMMLPAQVVMIPQYDFMGPLIYLSRPRLFPVSLAIKLFADSTSQTDFGAMFAMSSLSLLPVFLIFLFFNKYLMEGISTTGLRG